MRTFLAACIFAVGFAVAPQAQAYQGSGFNFYNQCGNAFAAGFANRAFCHSYLMGFADALSQDRAICFSNINDVQVVMVVQNWLRNHPAYLQNPAAFMIRNAMINTWRCR